MKATLTFNLPEENEEFQDAQNGTKYRQQLDNVWMYVFRPYHKHGYVDQKLNELLDTEQGKYIFEALESLFQEAKE